RAVARRIDAALEGIQTFVRSRFCPMDGVYGKTTVLGQMPDWNPAEMIGRAPRKLAYSLYKTLITDDAWREARTRMGYSVPEGQPLMVSLAGQPFIDTRLSFHSYLPAGLSSETGNKLVNVWIERLRENPHLHDKVEFEVAITTWSFDLNERIRDLTGDVLSTHEKEEFTRTLKELTLNLVLGETKGGIRQAMEDIKELENRQDAEPPVEENPSIHRLFRMVENCIRYGTVPFSILARHGFIARTLLLSLEQYGILTPDEIHKFQSGIKTVAGELVEDMIRLQNGDIGRDEFMKRYGHLRPGTYDILSLRYDQIENFGQGESTLHPESVKREFALRGDQRSGINELLKKEGLTGLDADSLMDYLREATAGREYGKFVFTKTVSDMLELIARFAEQNGLSHEEISHVSLTDILSVATGSGERSVEDDLREKAEEGAETHVVSSAIRLPQVLFDEAGVHVVPFQVSHPNFITDKRIDAECISLKPGQEPPDISDKIVLIESADPGFDWIFAHRIAGLVTKYGGANSHMAIRCAEFMIPAAIGCGEQKYEQLIRSNKISLDCTAGLIQTQF
ncbi:MAG: PEP-utilizing enzyme, partial [Balneolaceae bacterium]